MVSGGATQEQVRVCVMILVMVLDGFAVLCCMDFSKVLKSNVDILLALLGFRCHAVIKVAGSLKILQQSKAVLAVYRCSY